MTKSLVIPIYKNEPNIIPLLETLREFKKEIADLEVVFVVDASPDNSWALLRSLLSEEPYSSRLILLSRNFGANPAVMTALNYARGEYISLMAADLQEPPHLIKQFFQLLENDAADVVIGQRIGREDPVMSKIFSAIYWKLYRRFINDEIPPGGVDTFACNRKVVDVLTRIKEHNTYISILIFWVGFRRKFVTYERQKREFGKSSWTFRKKLRLLLDTIFSFSDFPILLLTTIGGVGVFLSFILGSVTFISRILHKISVQGYSTLLIVMLFGFSALLFTQGIIGCYLWRCFENTKSRPLAVVARIDEWNNQKQEDYK
jgi:glycosyltransferase involved in cell wall biosynthesis